MFESIGVNALGIKALPLLPGLRIVKQTIKNVFFSLVVASMDFPELDVYKKPQVISVIGEHHKVILTQFPLA